MHFPEDEELHREYFSYLLLVTFIADVHITVRLISLFPLVVNQIYAVSITIRIVVSVISPI
jgi:hypothetical protein